MKPSRALYIAVGACFALTQYVPSPGLAIFLGIVSTVLALLFEEGGY